MYDLYNSLDHSSAIRLFYASIIVANINFYIAASIMIQMFERTVKLVNQVYVYVLITIISNLAPLKKLASYANNKQSMQ
jgi:hypothetical protein